MKMTVDLTSKYLGLELQAPLIASSSPLTGDLDSLRELEEAGISAVVLPSLFEEQIEQESMEVQRLLEFGAESFAEALGGYFPDLNDYNTGPGGYLRHLEEARETLSIPIVASLNGTTRGGWIKYATSLQDAGADALELNIFLISTDPYADGRTVEQRYLDLVSAGPYFSSLAHLAGQFVEAGAAGLVLFNRFYQPDIDLEELEAAPNLQLSTSVELRLPLRWVAILCRRVQASLAVTSGVHTAEDVLKSLLVGADAVMMASALLLHGPAHAAGVLEGVRAWLEENEYESVSQLKGSMSLLGAPNPDAFIRSNYMKELASYTSGIS
jgi:dihydroorotate dehydrogenase (fumarate)